MCVKRKKMDFYISHDRKEESIEAKARWFQSLSFEERMEALCYLTDIALEINPDLPYLKDDKQTSGRIQVLRKK